MNTTDLEPKVSARIGDPGAFLPRKLTPGGEPMEAVHRWAARAVVAGLTDGSLGYVQPDTDQRRQAVIDAAEAWAKTCESNGLDPRPHEAALIDAVRVLRGESVEPTKATTTAESDPYCDYGYPVSGRRPGVRWCSLRHGHSGLHYGANDNIGFVNASTVRRSGAR